jgi:hypothetical protein
MRAFLGVLIVLALGCGAFVNTLAQAPKAPDAPPGAEAAVGRFYTGGQQICSAVVVGPLEVLTAQHCTRDRELGDLRVGTDAGEPVGVREVFQFADVDLVSLTLESPLPPPYAVLGPQPAVGEELFVVGYGCSHNHTEKRLVRAVHYVKHVLFWGYEMEGKACRGDSGGAVFDANGRLVGVTWGFSKDEPAAVYATDVSL